MSEPAIRVEGLSKRYQIGVPRGRGDGLRHAVETAVRHPRRWWRDRRSQGRRAGAEAEFWALQDVSFDVTPGEVVGIIGRNGAGKSTLLKILSRITEPTRGRVTIEGRVASLLEVGTGFHPELTGRENIFLNGSILGMARTEIKAKFDEIVAFAEVERFLDTPVKRYSSGMYVRLAFAVAAHLEPEILIVDEVLAVGDAEFQKKCLGKMESVAKGEGRTVLFVSHNLGAVGRLCRSSLLLEAGRLEFAGATEEVLGRYLRHQEAGAGERLWAAGEGGTSDGRLTLRSLRVLDADGRVSDRVDIRQPVQVEVQYELSEPMPLFRLALRFVTADGTVAFTSSDSSDPDFERKPRGAGRYVSRCRVPGDLLNEGHYSLTLSADVPFQEVLFVAETALGFHVEQTGGVNSRFPERWPGAVCPALRWQTRRDAPGGHNGIVGRRDHRPEEVVDALPTL